MSNWMDTSTLRSMAKLMERESDPDDLGSLRARAVHWAADEIECVCAVCDELLVALKLTRQWMPIVPEAADRQLISHIETAITKAEKRARQGEDADAR